MLGSDEPVGITRNDFEEAFLAFVRAYELTRPRMNADLAVRALLRDRCAVGAREGCSRARQPQRSWDEQAFRDGSAAGPHPCRRRLEDDARQLAAVAGGTGGDCG